MEYKSCRKMVSVRKIEGVNRLLNNTSRLQIKCSRMLHEDLVVPVLLF